jgi:hypothetical protein
MSLKKIVQTLAKWHIRKGQLQKGFILPLHTYSHYDVDGIRIYEKRVSEDARDCVN